MKLEIQKYIGSISGMPKLSVEKISSYKNLTIYGSHGYAGYRSR